MFLIINALYDSRFPALGESTISLIADNQLVMVYGNVVSVCSDPE